MIFLIKSIGLVLIIVISMMFTSSSSNDLEGLTTEQLTTEQLTTEQLTTEEKVFNKFIKDFENIKQQTTDLAKKTVSTNHHKTNAKQKKCLPSNSF
jgi:hypothetical protein